MFDALYGERDLRLVLARHEQGAVHAADGYARSTGRVGVCLVTSGPGATNTVTGLATANFDSVPLVVLTGQVTRNMIGNDAFQEADIVGISRSVTKHNYLVTDRKDLGRIIREAFYIARSGRPGARAGGHAEGRPHRGILRAAAGNACPSAATTPCTRGHPLQIRKAAQALAAAKKPLFYVGGGLHIAGAAEAFRAVEDAVDVPTVSSLMGIGVLPSVTRGSSAWSACTAPTRRTPPCRTATCSSPSGPGSTTAPRATSRSSPPTPRWCTSTSIRPRSRATSPWRSPSWGTRGWSSRTSCRTCARPAMSSGWRKPTEWMRTHPLVEIGGNGQALSHGRDPRHRGGVSRRHRRHRGGPEPDVDRPVLHVPRAALVPDLRRPGHHGLRLSRGHRRAARATRTAASSTSPATAPSR